MSVPSNIARICVLAASLLTVLSASAEAVTWHNTGSTSFTATGGPATFSAGASNLACTASSETGTAPGGSTVATTYSISGTMTYSPCTLIGQSVHISCGYTFTGTTFSAGVTSGTTDTNCTVRLTAASVDLCIFHGTRPSRTTNVAGSNRSTITILTNDLLKATNATPNTCPLGHNVFVHETHQTMTVTNGTPTFLGWLLNRTA